MANFLQQLTLLRQLQQAPMLPELPPGPSLDHVRGPIEIPLLETWQVVLIAAFGVLIVGLLSWKLFLSIRKQERNHSQVPPLDAAITELESAASLAAENDERFAVLTSLAVRRYFKASKGVDTMGKTTDEFLKSLDDRALLDADARSSLSEFLQQCDRVKFAKLPLAPEERQALTKSALGLIQECETKQIETDTLKTQS